MSKKKASDQNPEIEDTQEMDDFDKHMKEWLDSMVWTTAKNVLLYAIDSTITKFVTDVSVAQYLSDYQKQAIKSFREAVFTLVDFYKKHPLDEEVDKMVADCAKKLEQLFVTSTADMENPNKFVAEGQFRPSLRMMLAFDEARHWTFQDSQESIHKKLSEIVIDPNNVVGFYGTQIEKWAEMTYNNSKAYLSQPDMDEWETKGKEVEEYYLERPEVDDSEKLKLQHTPNFDLPLSDVNKVPKNYGAYKNRFNNIFKKAAKDGLVMTDEDFKAINQYLEEHLWYAAKEYSEKSEDPLWDYDYWLRSTTIVEAVFTSIIKALGNPKIIEYYNSNLEFRTNILETALNAMYLLCYYLPVFGGGDPLKRVYNFVDDVTEEYDDEIKKDFKLVDFYYYLEDLNEYF